MNNRLKYATNPAIYKDALQEIEKLNGITNSLHAYCKHCMTLTYTNRCLTCNSDDLQPIIINLQKGID